MDDRRSIINLILYFTLPAVVLKTFYQAKLSPSLLIVFLISLIFGLLMTIAGIFFFRNHLGRSQKGLLMSSCIGFNIGLFAYPFVEAFWGRQGLLNIAMFDLGNAFIVFGASYAVAAIYSPRAAKVDFFYILKKLLFFVPLQCYVVAITFVFLDVKYPPIVLRFLDIVAAANTVLVLLVIGMFLSFRIEKKVIKATVRVLTVRYILGIIVGIFIYFFLPETQTIRNTIVLGLILPVGMSAIPYSVLFDYDVKLAGALVNISNVVSFLIMWFLITSL